MVGKRIHGMDERGEGAEIFSRLLSAAGRIRRREMPLISIAMATYNGEKYLREQLDSILAQTHQNFELIVCDDCSTDSTVRILQEYEKNDGRIKVFINEKNLGFKKNFEKAIGLCSGDYIALSDQDDIWLPEHIEILLKKISDKQLVCGDDFIIDADGTENGDLLSSRLCFDFEKNYDLFFRIVCNTTVFSGHSCLYARKLIEKTLPFPKKCESHDGWISACAAVLNNAIFIPDVVSKYRIHGRNVSGEHTKTKFIRRLEILFNEKFQTDRLSYFDLIFLRFPEISEKRQNDIKNCKRYLENRVAGKHRFWTLKFLLKHYSDIYTTNSKKEVLYRIASVLLKKGGTR